MGRIEIVRDFGDIIREHNILNQIRLAKSEDVLPEFAQANKGQLYMIW